MSPRSKVLQPRNRRQGATAVEFAMTAPLLFLLLFGALELGHANMIYNVTEAAAYEGARQGIVPGATAQDCVNAANAMLDASRIKRASVEVSPANLTLDTDVVAVTVSVSLADNSVVRSLFSGRFSIQHTCELARERR